MLHKFHQSLLLFFVGTSFLLGQKSAVCTNENKDFDRAVDLYNEQQFVSAAVLFEKASLSSINEEIKSDCFYFLGICAFRNNQVDAPEKMEQFISNYPTSRKNNQAFLELGHFYFKESSYKIALEWFEKVDDLSLSDSYIDQFYFQKGYAYFSSKKGREAAICFNKVINSKEFGIQAKYYLGFIAYEGDDYNKANNYFESVSNDEKYKEKLSYYQAYMNFKLGNFQKAIDLGISAIEKANANEISQLNKIIGESFFNLKLYDKSIPFLALYKGINGKWNNTDYYQLGYANYMQKDYEKAILQFNKIISGKDFIAQNAYYQLGESYLNLNQKLPALNAFKNASDLLFDNRIQEDASFNYAKLSYEIGNPYHSTPSILMDFLKKYPRNSNSGQIESLLIDSYISSQNYKEALLILNKNRLLENKLAYQKVTFFRGLELYNERKFQEAKALFILSFDQQKDNKFCARAIYWKAAAEYILEDYKNSLLSYKQFQGFAEAKETAEYKNSNYNIAYCYFKIKEYNQAGNFFLNQIKIGKTDKKRWDDAHLRLADCWLVISKYVLAIEYYSKVIELKSLDADYAQFQKAMCNGFISKNEIKIQELNSFLATYSKSDYRDDAYFELANTYTTENKNDLALKTYEKLNAEFKNSAFTSKAILRQGLIYYNTEKEDLAISKFKKVVADFPKTPESFEAISTARLIYVDKGKVEDYASWVRSLDFVSVTDAELDNDTYEVAEKQYLQNNSEQAIIGFTNYISKFKNGVHALKSNFYLAQLYFAGGQEHKSVPNYEYVVGQTLSEFTEQALTRLAQIFLKDKNIDKAISILVRLENLASTQQNTSFAQSNLMICYYETKDYPNSVVYSEKVLNNLKTDSNVKSDAQIIIARAAIKMGDETKARNAYAKLLTLTQGELAAEAIYYEAYFKNKEEKFEASNVVVQKLAKNYSSYKYFGAKGLILMAKNFYGLKDSFQATYILESVVKNFTDFSDILVEAQKELDAIKSEEGKTNSSVAP